MNKVSFDNVFDFSNVDKKEIKNSKRLNQYKTVKQFYTEIEYIKHNEEENLVYIKYINKLDGNFIEVIYKYIHILDVYNQVKFKKTIDLDFYYIDNVYGDSSYQEISFKGEKIPSIFARYSFWYMGVNFSEAIFDGAVMLFDYSEFHGNMLFKNAQLNVKRLSFRYANFLKIAISFDNTKFENTFLDFHKAIFEESKLSMQNSELVGCNISFEKIFSNSDMNFKNARFKRSTKYSNRKNQDICFQGSDFHKAFISFEKTYFQNQYINFTNSKFEKGVLKYSEARLKNSEIIINSVEAGCNLLFNDMYLNKSNIEFFGTNFEEKINFKTTKCINGKIEFKASAIRGTAINFNELNMQSGILDFTNVEFGISKVNFIALNCIDSEIGFHKVHYGYRVINFTNSNIGSVIFERSTFNCKEVIFNNVTVDKLKFEEIFIDFNLNLSVEKINILEIEKCNIKADISMDKDSKGNYIKYSFLSFKDTSNSGRIYIDLIENNVIEAIENSVIEAIESSVIEAIENSVVEEKENSVSEEKENSVIEEIENSVIEEKENSVSEVKELDVNDKITKIKHSKFERLSMQYRLLKNNFNEIGYYNDEDKSLVKYMDNYLLSKDKKISKHFGHLVGGYGTSPKSIAITSVVVILAFAFIYWGCGLHIAPPSEVYQTSFYIISDSGEPAHQIPIESINSNLNFMDLLYFSGITFLTIGYGDITPTNGWVQLFTIFEGLFGVFLMSYFSVAVIRKILR